MALIVLLLVSIGCPKQQGVRTKEIEGVKHILNPQKPIKGIVHLDIEKTSEIDPYQYEEIGLKYIRFKRGKDGSVILFDTYSSNVEAHLFSPDKKYLGRILRQGQGPGEFSPYSGIDFYIEFYVITVTGARKIAFLDKQGRFLTERRLTYHPDILIDEDRFFIHQIKGIRENRNEKIILREQTDKEKNKYKETVFFEAVNVGMIYTKTGAFTDM